MAGTPLEQSIYERALRADADFGEAGVNLAILHAEAGRLEAARRVARSVLHVERTRPLAAEVLRRLR